MSKRPYEQGMETGDPPVNGVKMPRLDAHNGIGQPPGDVQQPKQHDIKPATGASAATATAPSAAPVGGAAQAPAAPQAGPKSRILEPPKPPVIHYSNGKPLRDIGQYYKSDRRLVEVVIPSSSMTGNNKQVKARQLWGDHVYTDDSDIVAVLMHLGYYATNNTSNPPQVLEFRALIQLLPPHDHYSSCFRNQVRSRAWFARVDGCSYQVQKCWLVTRSGNSVPLAPCAEEGAITAPTFAPSNGDRAMTTRAAAASSGRPKALAEVTVLYNLCNEPWLKFSMAAVSDRGLKQRQWSSARLRKEVLFLETQSERFQISYAYTGPDTELPPNAYVLSRCKSALPLPVMRRVGVPLPATHVEELESGLAWDDLQWGNLSLKVRGREFKVVRVHFMKAVKPTEAK